MSLRPSNLYSISILHKSQLMVLETRSIMYDIFALLICRKFLHNIFRINCGIGLLQLVKMDEVV